MQYSSWLLFASIIFVASVSPGPNVLAVIVKTLDSGIKGAVFTILGNLLALFTIAFAAALGVGAMLQAAPSVYMTMKIAGGLYLAWMGFKMLRSSFNSLPSIDVSKPKVDTSAAASAFSLIAQAMLISYSNPKSILFLSAVFPTFLNTAESVPIQFGIMFCTIIGIVTLIHGFYAILTIRLRGSHIGVGARKWMARISGVSFVGFGVGFVYSSQR